MEKKKTPLAIPILNTITAVLYTLSTVFSVLALLEGQQTALWSLVVYGFCAVMQLITAVLNWNRYFKEKSGEATEEQPK